MKEVVDMKKLLIVFILFAYVGGIASAQSVDVPGTPLSQDVEALYVEEAGAEICKADIVEGKASVQTETGITIEVDFGDAAFESGVILVVRQFTPSNTEAYAWFAEILKGKGKSILPFEIYLKKDGQRIQPVPQMKISITLPNGYANPLIYGVNTSGNVSNLSLSVKNQMLTFETEYWNYFVLAENENPLVSAPATGDVAQPYFLFFLICLSVLFVGFLTKQHVLYSKLRKRARLFKD
jgi:hypothetical protein